MVFLTFRFYDSKNGIENQLVGAARLELATPRSQSECATKLRHAPLILKKYGVNGGI